jgi:hypothetical protein
MADGSRRSAQEREEARREREAARAAREASERSDYGDGDGSGDAPAIDEPLISPRGDAHATADDAHVPDDEPLAQEPAAENGTQPGGPPI